MMMMMVVKIDLWGRRLRVKWPTKRVRRESGWFARCCSYAGIIAASNDDSSLDTCTEQWQWW